MATMVTAQAAPQMAAEDEATFEQLMVEAHHLNELMDNDRIEIEKLKTESKAIREETRALLTAIGAKL